MPENAAITFISSSLPEGACYASDQARFNAFAAALRGFLPGSYSTFVVGNTTPVVEDQGKIWYRLTADGFGDRIYYFSNGLWLAPHFIPASSRFISMWNGSLTDLKTFDGGEDTAITSTTGPFWTEVTTMRQRMPIGVGTLPLSGTIIPVTGTGGLDQVTLTDANLPPHTHDVALTHGHSYTGGPNVPFVGNGASTPELQTVANAATAKAAAATAVDNTPPFYGIYFIARTARQYYRAI